MFYFRILNRSIQGSKVYPGVEKRRFSVANDAPWFFNSLVQITTGGIHV